MHEKKLALKIFRNTAFELFKPCNKQWLKNARISSHAKKERVFYQPRDLDLLHETEELRDVGAALCLIPAATSQAPAQ